MPVAPRRASKPQTEDISRGLRDAEGNSREFTPITQRLALLA